MQPTPVTETAQGAPLQLTLAQQRVRPEGKEGDRADGAISYRAWMEEGQESLQVRAVGHMQ